MSIHFKSFFIVYDPKKIHNLFSIYEFENLMIQYHAGYNLVLVTNVVSIFVLMPAHCTKFYLLKWTQIENHKHVQKYELHSKDIWRHQLYVSVKIFWQIQYNPDFPVHTLIFGSHIIRMLNLFPKFGMSNKYFQGWY